LADAYVRATNTHDASAFVALFADDAVVDDGGRFFLGREAIRAWSQSDIFDVNVTLEVLGVSDSNGSTTIFTKVDGTFDRTGLPDPVVISQCLETADEEIVRLTCRLADAETVKAATST